MAMRTFALILIRISGQNFGFSTAITGAPAIMFRRGEFMGNIAFAKLLEIKCMNMLDGVVAEVPKPSTNNMMTGPPLTA